MLCQGAGTRTACGVPLNETVLCSFVQVFFFSVHSHFAKVLGPGLLVNSPRLCWMLLLAGRSLLVFCLTRQDCSVFNCVQVFFFLSTHTLQGGGPGLLVLCCPTHQGCSVCYCAQVALCLCCVVWLTKAVLCVQVALSLATRTLPRRWALGSWSCSTCWRPTVCWTKKWATVRASASSPAFSSCMWDSGTEPRLTPWPPSPLPSCVKLLMTPVSTRAVHAPPSPTVHAHIPRCLHSRHSQMFSSRWYLWAWKNPYALQAVTQRFPQCCLWNGSSVLLIDDGPLLLFQGQLSNASSFHAPLLQAIDGVMSLVLCLLLVSQALQHFRSYKKQATCVQHCADSELQTFQSPYSMH